MFKMYLLACASLLASALCPMQGLAEQDAKLAPEVVDSLRKSVEQLSPLSLKWRKSVRAEGNKEEALRSMGFNPVGLDFFEPRTVTYTIDFPRVYVLDRHRAPRVDDKGKIVPKEFADVEREASFDGQKYYNGNPVAGLREKGAFPISLIQSPAEMVKAGKGDDRMMRPDYFDAIGYRLPSTAEEHVNPELSSDVLKTIESGVPLEVKSDARSLSIAATLSDGIVEYELDPTSSYAVRRIRRATPEGKTLRTHECSEFVQVDDSALWLPRHCKVRYHSYGPAKEKIFDEPLFVEEYELLEYNKDNPDDELFVVDYRDVPGSYITDASLPSNRISYRVPANPASLPQVIDAARNRLGGRPRSWTGVVIAANVVIVISLLLFYWWYRLRAASQSRSV